MFIVAHCRLNAKYFSQPECIVNHKFDIICCDSHTFFVLENVPDFFNVLETPQKALGSCTSILLGVEYRGLRKETDRR